jgi:hypothetical protein
LDGKRRQVYLYVGKKWELNHPKQAWYTVSTVRRNMVPHLSGRGGWLKVHHGGNEEMAG